MSFVQNGGVLAITRTGVLWIKERCAVVCVLRHEVRHLQFVILTSASYFPCLSDF
jgi:hypothetical protein